MIATFMAPPPLSSCGTARPAAYRQPAESIACAGMKARGWRRGPNSSTSPPRKHGRNCLHENLEVQREGPVARIARIQRHSRDITAVAAPAHLPEAGQARWHREALRESLAISRDFGFHDRPRPDEAHLPGQDVEQLGQLVQARAPQELPERRNAWIARELLIFCPLPRGL